MTGPERRASSVTRNALSGGGRHVVSAVLALAVTPYALKILGADRFGAWVLAGTVLLTIRTFDLGLERALIRSVANADGAGRLGKAQPILVVGRRMLVGSAIAFAGAIAIGRGPIIEWLLKIPEALHAEATYALIGTAAVAVVEAWFRPLSAALDGVGRMDRSRSIDMFQRILSSLGVAMVLGLGYGLRGLVWKNLATALFAGALYMRAARQTAPELMGRGTKSSASTRPRRSSVSVRLGDVPEPAPLDRADLGARAIARDLLAFGGHVQAVGISALAYDVWVKVILGRTVGLGGVAIYELGARVVVLLAGSLQAAAEAIFPEASVRHGAAIEGGAAEAIFPAASESQAAAIEGGAAEAIFPAPSESQAAAFEGGAAEVIYPAASVSPAAAVEGGTAVAAESRRALAGLHARAGRVLAWLALPAFGLLFVLAVPFATAWLGPDYTAVGGIIRVLSAGWLVAILAGPAYLIAQAGGRAVDSTAAAIVTAVVAMMLSAALVGPFGALGVAAAVSSGLAIGAVVLWWRFARGFGVGWGILRIVDPKAVAATGVGMLVAQGTLRVLGTLAAPRALGDLRALGSASSLAGVIAAGLVGGAAYLAAMLALGAFGAEERRILKDALFGFGGTGSSEV